MEAWTEERAAVVDAALGEVRVRYCPFEPTVKQELFMLLDQLEVFFGGAAGPGKSWGLLMAALQYVDIPGYHALLLRPTLTEFEQRGGLIEASHEWLDASDAHWHGTKREWTFPSGATVRFGYVSSQGDIGQYKGAAYSFVGFDELTSWPTDRLYRMLFRVLRQRKDALPGVPLRMRSASNPGDVGHCVPYGDVLTPQGWRPIESMRVGDPCYAVTPDGELVPSKVEQVHQHLASEIVTVDAKGFHMAVTPEHRVAKVGGTREKPGASFSLVPFDDLPGQTNVLRTVSWHCSPLAAVTVQRPARLRRSRVKQPSVLSGPQYARLLGWFLTEGSLVDRDRAVAIAQTKPASRERLRAFLEDDCGFTVSWSKSGATLYAASWWNHLRQYAPGKCRDKAVPSSIKNAPPEVLAAFLEAAMDGDGCRRPSTGHGSFYSFSERLSDDVAEIAVKLGYIVRCSRRTRPGREGFEHRVDLKRTRSGGTEILTGQHRYDVQTVTRRRSDVKRWRAANDCPVYCIGLPDHHAFVIRQHGSVWVSGNSWVKARFIDEKMKEPDAVFVRARITDNPNLDYAEYLKSLAHLTPVDRERLINGDWDVEEEGGVFDRANFQIVKPAAVEEPVQVVRYWDLAATEPSNENPDPDWTVGVLLELDSHGTFTVRGDKLVRGQWKEDGVEDAMLTAAQEDGIYVPIRIEQEPGSAGKNLIAHYQRTTLQGYEVSAGLTRGKGKEVRARPWASAVANGLVQITPGVHVQDYLDEHAIFPQGAHDDCVDASSGAHTFISDAPIPRMPLTAARIQMPRRW